MPANPGKFKRGPSTAGPQVLAPVSTGFHKSVAGSLDQSCDEVGDGQMGRAAGASAGGQATLTSFFPKELPGAKTRGGTEKETIVSRGSPRKAKMSPVPATPRRDPAANAIVELEAGAPEAISTNTGAPTDDVHIKTSATASASDATAVEDPHLSEYEKLRASNMRRNNAILESLDIPAAAIPVAQANRQASERKTAKKRKPSGEFREYMEEPRRSGRRLALAEAAQQVLVALPDSWDETDERKTAAPKRAAIDIKELEDADWHSLQPPPDMQELLDTLGKAQTTVARTLSVSDWKSYAIDTWGPAVARAKVDDWAMFVSSRCSVQPDVTGSDMLQERFQHDVWRLLMACLLMTRVSSAETKDRALAGFFRAFPTPSALQAAADDSVFEEIKALGLFDTRIRGLRDVTQRFLSMPRFMIGLDKELKPYGCGPFVYESYLIFCCGQGADIQATDKNLRAYCAWLRRNLNKPEPGTCMAVEI